MTGWPSHLVAARYRARAARSRTRVSLWLVVILGAIRASSLTIRSLGLGLSPRTCGAFGSFFSLRGSMREPPFRVRERVGNVMPLHGEGPHIILVRSFPEPVRAKVERAPPARGLAVRGMPGRCGLA